jgi:hypothetical protein
MRRAKHTDPAQEGEPRLTHMIHPPLPVHLHLDIVPRRTLQHALHLRRNSHEVHAVELLPETSLDDERGVGAPPPVRVEGVEETCIGWLAAACPCQRSRSTVQ